MYTQKKMCVKISRIRVSQNACDDYYFEVLTIKKHKLTHPQRIGG